MPQRIQVTVPHHRPGDSRKSGTCNMCDFSHRMTEVQKLKKRVNSNEAKC